MFTLSSLGACNGNFNQLITYDCRAGSDGVWYADGKYSSGQTAYTPVYVDPWIKQSMVSFVHSIRNLDAGQFVGVSSGDLLTISLLPSISKAKYLTNGRAILFETATGTIISDSTWSTNYQQIELSTYNQLVGISISNDDWSQINNGLQNSLVELSSYYVISQLLATGNGQYLLSSFVNKDDLFSLSLYPMLHTIDSMNQKDAGILAGCLVGLVIIVPLIMWWLIDDLMKPIQRVTDEAKQIVQNLGGADLAEGIEIVKPNRHGPVEAQEMNAAFNELVQNLTKQRQRQQNPNQLNVIDNRFYGKSKSSRSGRPGGVIPAFHGEDEIKIAISNEDGPEGQQTPLAFPGSATSASAPPPAYNQY